MTEITFDEESLPKNLFYNEKSNILTYYVPEQFTRFRNQYINNIAVRAVVDEWTMLSGREIRYELYRFHERNSGREINAEL